MHHRSSGGHGAGNRFAAVGHEQLEEDNSRQEEELRQKVGVLKSLTIDIGDEVREHNRLLRDADDTFDSVGGLLGATIGKVKQLATSGHRRHFLYLFVFALFVVLVLWAIIR